MVMKNLQAILDIFRVLIFVENDTIDAIKKVEIVEINHELEEIGPGEPAHPDDQGQYSTCTRHALSKAIVDGYEDGIFEPRKIDFDQTDTTQKLINLHPGQENQGKYPDKHFNKRAIILTEQNTGDVWNVTLSVNSFNPILVNNVIKADIQFYPEYLFYVYQKTYNVPDALLQPFFWIYSKFKNSYKREHKYVMSYNNRSHCVYVKYLMKLPTYDGHAHLVAYCLNSHPKEPHVYQNVEHPDNEYFQVKCNAKLSQNTVARSSSCIQSPPHLHGPWNMEFLLLGLGHFAIHYLNDLNYEGPRGVGNSAEENQDNYELGALSKAIIEGSKKKFRNIKISQEEIKKKMDKNKKKYGESIERFDEMEISNALIKIVKVELSEASLAKPECCTKYVMEYPVDYTKPDGATHFAFFTQVLKHEGRSIAYCEKENKIDAKFIPLENKGNRFFKVDVLDSQQKQTMNKSLTLKMLEYTRTPIISSFTDPFFIPLTIVLISRTISWFSETEEKKDTDHRLLKTATKAEEKVSINETEVNDPVQPAFPDGQGAQSTKSQFEESKIFSDFSHKKVFSSDSEEPISVTHLSSLATTGDLSKQDFESDDILKRIVKSGLTDEDIETLSSLVKSKELPVDFMKSLANIVKEDQTSCSSNPISVSDLKTTATLSSCGYLPSDFIKNIDTGYLRRIVQSGIKEDDMKTLIGLVSSTVLPNDFIPKISNVIKDSWSSLVENAPPSFDEVLTAATFAAENVLTSVKNMVLHSLDISLVPHDHLAKLSSIISDRVEIDSVKGDISVIISNIKCKQLHISNQTQSVGTSASSVNLAKLSSNVSGVVMIDNVSEYLSSLVTNIKCERLDIKNLHLSQETSNCLVEAMRKNVEEIRLGLGGGDGVHFEDIDALTVYSGEGRCQSVECRGATVSRYMSNVETWGRNIGWDGEVSGSFIHIYRK